MLQCCHLALPVALIQHLWPYLKKGPGQLTSLSFIISLWTRKMRWPLNTACWHIKMPNEKLSATVCMNPEFPSTSPVYFLQQKIVQQDSPPQAHSCQMGCTANLSILTFIHRYLPFTNHSCHVFQDSFSRIQTLA